MKNAKTLPANMKVHVKFIERIPGKDDVFRWECNGVIFNAKNILEAQDKWLRKKGFR